MATEISDWNDLDAARTDLAGDYALTADLDSGTAGYADHASETANGGEGWQPIGDSTTPFTGAFDGDDHSIADLHSNLGRVMSGIFGVAENAHIHDLSILGADIYDEHDASGVLAGMLTGATEVWNCHTSGSVSGPEYNNGGFVGSVGDTAHVHDCSSDATVIGVGQGTLRSRRGGFTGFIGGDPLIERCTVSGSVESDGDECGGFVGRFRGTATIRDCYTAASVVEGIGEVGGFAGRIRDAGPTIERCYSRVGTINGSSNVGGFAGTEEDGATVDDSFWDQELSGETSSAAATGKSTAEMEDIETYTNVAETVGLDTAWDMVTLQNFTGAETWVIGQGAG